MIKRRVSGERSINRPRLASIGMERRVRPRTAVAPSATISRGRKRRAQVEPPAAMLDLAGVGRWWMRPLAARLELEVLDRIGEVGRARGRCRPRPRPVEQLAGRADERAALPGPPGRPAARRPASAPRRQRPLAEHRLRRIRHRPQRAQAAWHPGAAPRASASSSAGSVAAVHIQCGSRPDALRRGLAGLRQPRPCCGCARGLARSAVRSARLSGRFRQYFFGISAPHHRGFRRAGLKIAG